MNISIFLTLVLFLLAVPIQNTLDTIPNVQTPTSSWELKRDKKGIKVYTKNSPETKIKAFKVEALVQAPLDTVLKIMNDVPGYINWQADVSLTTIVETVDEQEFYYYFTVATPWPFSDRDNVMHTVVSETTDPREVTYTLNGKPEYLAEKEEFVRLPIAKGVWIFTSKDSTRTMINHEFVIDPGGNLPAWLINAKIVDSPFFTVANLVKLAEK